MGRVDIDVLRSFSVWPSQFLTFLERVNNGSEERTKRTEANKHQADRDCYESEEWRDARPKEVKE